MLEKGEIIGAVAMSAPPCIPNAAVNHVRIVGVPLLVLLVTMILLNPGHITCCHQAVTSLYRGITGNNKIAQWQQTSDIFAVVIKLQVVGV